MGSQGLHGHPIRFTLGSGRSPSLPVLLFASFYEIETRFKASLLRSPDIWYCAIDRYRRDVRHPNLVHLVRVCCSFRRGEARVGEIIPQMFCASVGYDYDVGTYQKPMSEHMALDVGLARST